MNQPHPEPAADAIAAVADHIDRLVADVLLDAREVAEQSEELSRVVGERAAALARDVRRYASERFER
jgi:hypothetical protein